MAKSKYYVVWHGVTPGIYTSWEECKEQVIGCEGAIYKGFPTLEEAEEAYDSSPDVYISKAPSGSPKGGETEGEGVSVCNEGESNAVSAASSDETEIKTIPVLSPPVGAGGGYTLEAVAVDAACSGNPGPMEYRGVYLRTGQVIFHFGPVYGTNNIGEFLAIVHALALMKQKGVNMPIYSDSRNAILWVRQKKCKTQLERTPRTEELYLLIERAEKWLRENPYTIPVLKWETRQWGEVPADFGRK